MIWYENMHNIYYKVNVKSRKQKAEHVTNSACILCELKWPVGLQKEAKYR